MKIYLDTTSEDKKIKVEVDYSRGGINYLSGNMNDRGVYVYVTPVTLTRHTFSDGKAYTTESFAVFHGLKKLIMPLMRRNASKQQIASNQIKDELAAKTGVYELVQKVAQNEGLVLA